MENWLTKSITQKESEMKSETMAEYLACGGKVTQCRESESTRLNESAIRHAARNGGKVNSTNPVNHLEVAQDAAFSRDHKFAAEVVGGFHNATIGGKK